MLNLLLPKTILVSPNQLYKTGRLCTIWAIQIEHWSRTVDVHSDWIHFVLNNQEPNRFLYKDILVICTLQHKTPGVIIIFTIPIQSQTGRSNKLQWRQNITTCMVHLLTDNNSAGRSVGLVLDLRLNWRSTKGGAKYSSLSMSTLQLKTYTFLSTRHCPV